MFELARKDVLRFGTPDPEDDWTMFGHLLVGEGELVLVDPPLVPGLIKSMERIGRLKGIIITTGNHTRGAKYIAEKTGATIFLPDQDPEAVDPKGAIAIKNIGSHETYGTGDLLGLKAFKLTDEYALVTKKNEMIVGDSAIGTVNGKAILTPEWFPHEPRYPENQSVHKEFKKLVTNTRAKTLLASHGENIYGTLEEAASKL